MEFDEVKVGQTVRISYDDEVTSVYGYYFVTGLGTPHYVETTQKNRTIQLVKDVPPKSGYYFIDDKYVVFFGKDGKVSKTHTSPFSYEFAEYFGKSQKISDIVFLCDPPESVSVKDQW